MECFRILCLTLTLSAQLAVSFPGVRTTCFMSDVYSQLQLFKHKTCISFLSDLTRVFTDSDAPGAQFGEQRV